jgi:hypothetical protein
LLVDELHLAYGRLTYDPAVDLERVSADRTHPRALEASTGDQVIAGAQDDPGYLHRYAAIPSLLVEGAATSTAMRSSATPFPVPCRCGAVSDAGFSNVQNSQHDTISGILVSIGRAFKGGWGFHR